MVLMVSLASLMVSISVEQSALCSSHVICHYMPSVHVSFLIAKHFYAGHMVGRAYHCQECLTIVAQPS